MKVNKYISLDDELVKELQREDNASKVINDLVKAHYDEKDVKNIDVLYQKLAKIKQIIKENRRIAKDLVKNIQEINKKNKDFFSIFKKAYPEKLIERLKKIENLDYETAHAIALEFDLHRRGVGGIKLLKVWEEIKNNVLE